MTFNRTVAISKRIVKQIFLDHRSLAMIFVAPLVVMSLVGASFNKNPQLLNFVAPALICTFVLFFTFILTGISFLRERALGTLDRLLTTPVSRADIMLGYSISFFFFAFIQSNIILFFTIFILDISYQGGIWNMFIVVILTAIVAVNLGVFISTFAKNEFQVIQFIPLLLAPQIFLSGVIQPVENLPNLLQNVSKVLPLTYAVEGLRSIMIDGSNLSGIINQIATLIIFACVFVILATLTIKR
tara:strand:- start:5536 stop:6264 length:729 start_codon:yes stop_codon:yes gene_type:complete